ncbi:MAG: 50S ribosomal protein L30 [Polyangiaceae bacterium UTPRO1]|jgi:large subunit ribosomal protein L30|nr:50S ribosomal protein L30 [Myxococcales bacterium]OQY65896.1 MAG: 50S ribosomal protein L30 [Polyangiaceae bacterium UTPRO1]
MVEKKITVKQVRSEIGGTRRQRESLRGLGLRGIGRSVTVADNTATRGLIDKVAHLVKVGD